MSYGQSLASFRQFFPNAFPHSHLPCKIEDWHDSVHHNAKKYGVNFGNPEKNMYMKKFWQFAKFVTESSACQG